MGLMNYHGKQACVDVKRLANWSKPALNAIKAEAYFVAADSGQAAHQT